MAAPMRLPPLTLAHSPISGLGDRFSAWLAIFALARLRGRDVVIRDWQNVTRSGVGNQQHDVATALACLVLP